MAKRKPRKPFDELLRRVEDAYRQSPQVERDSNGELSVLRFTGLVSAMLDSMHEKDVLAILYDLYSRENESMNIDDMRQIGLETATAIITRELMDDLIYGAAWKRLSADKTIVQEEEMRQELGKIISSYYDARRRETRTL